MTWDKEKFHYTLANWPENETINWTQVAREHAKNGGQIVKEFAREKGIHTEHLDNRKGGVQMRAKKPGGEISVPCHKTVDAIKDDCSSMIESGELTLGEPCAPYTVMKYAIINGEVQQSEIGVYGRKVSLLHIRKKLLKKHENFMRLHTDTQIDSMSRCEIFAILSKSNIAVDNETSDTQLRDGLRKLERTRTLA